MTVQIRDSLPATRGSQLSSLEPHVRRVLASAPALTDERADHIVAILRPSLPS